MPSEDSPNGEIEHYESFSLSYSENHEQPYWVCYELTQGELMVHRPRTNHFRSDPNISSKSASLRDYRNSGYDRGHIVRASFCKESENGYRQSYYLSNMSPQHQDINRTGKIWYRLEDAEMYFAYALDTVYSASGPIFKQNKGSVGTNKVTIPGFFYKVIISEKYKKGIGFIIPHERSSRNIFEFAKTIDEVERETGIDFFHNANDQLEVRLESSFDKEFWEICFGEGRSEFLNPEEYVQGEIFGVWEALEEAENFLLPELQVASWNIESGGADIDTITSVIENIVQKFGNIQLWGFSEVQDREWASKIRSTLGDSYWYQLGTTGRSDRLGIIYDRDYYVQVGDLIELHNINPEMRVRSPIVLRLRELETDLEFYFMVNHLYRGSAQGRQKQARELNRWVQSVDIPVIAVGDYNFDFDISTQNGNVSFDLFSDGDYFVWVRPEVLMSTQCNPAYNSILDFVFINNQGSALGNTESEIFSFYNDCDQSPYHSDHRAVIARFGSGNSE